MFENRARLDAGVCGASRGVGWLEGQAGTPEQEPAGVPAKPRSPLTARTPDHRDGSERDPGRRRAGVDARNEHRPQNAGRSRRSRDATIILKELLTAGQGRRLLDDLHGDPPRAPTVDDVEHDRVARLERGERLRHVEPPSARPCRRPRRRRRPRAARPSSAGLAEKTATTTAPRASGCRPIWTAAAALAIESNVAPIQACAGWRACCGSRRSPGGPRRSRSRSRRSRRCLRRGDGVDADRACPVESTSAPPGVARVDRRRRSAAAPAARGRPSACTVRSSPETMPWVTVGPPPRSSGKPIASTLSPSRSRRRAPERDGDEVAELRRG